MHSLYWSLGQVRKEVLEETGKNACEMHFFFSIGKLNIPMQNNVTPLFCWEKQKLTLQVNNCNGLKCDFPLPSLLIRSYRSVHTFQSNKMLILSKPILLPTDPHLSCPTLLFIL